MLVDPPSSTLKRQFGKARRLAALKARNLSSRRPVIDPNATVDVSLTSFGERLETVGYAVESIAQGSALPRRFVLWVSDPDFDLAGYPMLRRLVSRGLEIRTTEDYGPYKKSYPYATELREPGIGLVTADDDALYPEGWLRGLQHSALEHPEDVIGFRAAAVSFDAAGKPLPYARWRRLEQPESGAHVLLTGVAGIYYPYAFLTQLAAHGEEFRTVCPSADDLWMHRISLLAGITPRMVASGSMYLLSIPKTQQNPLHKVNVSQGRNDLQFAAISTENELQKMRISAQGSVR
ncbi:MAG: hypothetical protein L0G87_07960 [Renibacterium salmoninarum]|nr:hypothetical protein [Renibacterium salmoninarum]